MLVHQPVIKGLFFAYPLLMTFVVVASGNHFWLDAVFGLMTAALATGVALLLARLNPDWSFAPLGPRAPAGELEPQPAPA
jgi:PAP2 superfamily